MVEKKPLKKQAIKVVEIDVLKPHKPSIVELGQLLCSEPSVSSANVSVYAIDEKTESVKVTLEGSNIEFEKVQEMLDNYGAVIHSIDKVIVGQKKVIETPSIEKPK